MNAVLPTAEVPTAAHDASDSSAGTTAKVTPLKQYTQRVSQMVGELKTATATPKGKQTEPAGDQLQHIEQQLARARDALVQHAETEGAEMLASVVAARRATLEATVAENKKWARAEKILLVLDGVDDEVVTAALATTVKNMQQKRARKN